MPVKRGGWIEDAAGNLFEILAIKTSHKGDLEGERVAIAIEILLDGARSYRYGDIAETLTQADLYGFEAWSIRMSPCYFSA